MTGQEKQIHTKGVLFSVSASKENTAGGFVTGPIREGQRASPPRQGRSGLGSEGGIGIHSAAAARPLSQGSGLTTRDIKTPSLCPTVGCLHSLVREFTCTSG